MNKKNYDYYFLRASSRNLEHNPLMQTPVNGTRDITCLLSSFSESKFRQLKETENIDEFVAKTDNYIISDKSFVQTSRGNNGIGYNFFSMINYEGFIIQNFQSFTIGLEKEKERNRKSNINLNENILIAERNIFNPNNIHSYVSNNPYGLFELYEEAIYVHRKELDQNEFNNLILDAYQFAFEKLRKTQNINKETKKAINISLSKGLDVFINNQVSSIYSLLEYKQKVDNLSKTAWELEIITKTEYPEKYYLASHYEERIHKLKEISSESISLRK